MINKILLKTEAKEQFCGEKRMGWGWKVYRMQGKRKYRGGNGGGGDEVVEG